MAIFYIIFKITSLLAVIILSVSGPKKKKALPKTEMSRLAVNSDGYLEHLKNNPEHHQPVQ